MPGHADGGADAGAGRAARRHRRRGRQPEGSAEWHPHVSFAYANATGPADPFEAALAGFDETAPMTVTAADLIRIGRDEHAYEWETYATVDLGS